MTEKAGRKDEEHTRLALEQVLRFVSSDVRNSSENVCAVGSRSFDAVSVVDTTFSSFLVDIKVCEIVVEIDRSGTEVTTEKSRVSSAGKSRESEVSFSRLRTLRLENPETYKIVVTSMCRFLHSGIASPTCHSWK